ncbi:MAG: helix-turn-helix domain-containing protein [Pirellulaceae bacterium]|nr:helix-turn-helix domain-containing protein [Pirellulaceae bacterium]
MSRRYEVPPSGNSKASLLSPETIDKIHALHAEGKGICEIARILGLSRKQVSRVLGDG